MHAIRPTENQNHSCPRRPYCIPATLRIPQVLHSCSFLAYFVCLRSALDNRRHHRNTDRSIPGVSLDPPGFWIARLRSHRTSVWTSDIGLHAFTKNTHLARKFGHQPKMTRRIENEYETDFQRTKKKTPPQIPSGDDDSSPVYLLFTAAFRHKPRQKHTIKYPFQKFEELEYQSNFSTSALDHEGKSESLFFFLLKNSPLCFQF